MNKLNKETKAYRNKLNYIREYSKQHTKKITISFNKENDAELLEFLIAQPNKSQTIRDMYEVYKKHR